MPILAPEPPQSPKVAQPPTSVEPVAAAAGAAVIAPVAPASPGWAFDEVTRDASPGWARDEVTRDASPGWVLMNLDWSARAEHARGGVRARPVWITAVYAGMRRLARWLRACPRRARH